MSARRNPVTRWALSLAGACALLGSLPASAEINGIINGRSADPGNLPARSIDIAVHDRDLAREFGVRFNFAVGPRVTGFVNAAAVDYDFRSASGYSVGGGAFIHLPNQRIWDYVDMALKPTINYFTVDGNFGYDLNIIQGGFDFLISSREPIPNTPLSWYANAGLAVLINDGTGNDDTDVEPQIGGGAYMDLGRGQLFFGVDILDGNPDLGVGYRFFL